MKETMARAVRAATFSDDDFGGCLWPPAPGHNGKVCAEWLAGK